MAHHTPGLEEEVNPLHFLQRSPVISILGDPLHLDLPIEVTTLAKISKSNAFLQSFLSSVVEAINQQLRELARIDNALTLNVDVLKESEKLITSIHACPQLTAPLELVVIFGTYLAASNGADINAPGSGAEETLHDRIQKHGSDGFIDLSRFGLAAAVLRASRSLGDVFSLGIKAACAALVFAFDVDLKAHKLLAQGQEMYQRLLVPAQDFETISTVEDVRVSLPFNLFCPRSPLIWSVHRFLEPFSAWRSSSKAPAV
jgi:Starter unit:ACP transacylase in aflatoxin biosynthesis